MKTNLVKLVINGENWGVYINLQQYNKDFLAEQFGTKSGVRWKVGPGRGGRLNLCRRRSNSLSRNVSTQN